MVVKFPSVVLQFTSLKINRSHWFKDTEQMYHTKKQRCNSPRMRLYFTPSIQIGSSLKGNTSKSTKFS